MAVLYLDLDGFKQVNDKYGHETGDVLLASTARSLHQCVLGADTVGRLGGDEFAVPTAMLEYEFPGATADDQLEVHAASGGRPDAQNG